MTSPVDDLLEQQSRICLMCHCKGLRVVSTLVSRDASGLEWFECEKHGPTDNLAQAKRISSVSIADWLRGHGL